MIWIDRLMLIWAVCLVVLLSLVMSGQPYNEFVQALPKVLGWAALAPWLLARALIWAFTGKVDPR